MKRLRAQGGFTLPEVLIAATIGFVVLAATIGLLESTLRLGTGISSKTDAMQRGRLALDTITQQLRSQVCLSRDVPAVVAGSSSSVTFYADFSDGTGVIAPVKRTLEFDAAGSDVRVFEYEPTVTPPVNDDSYPDDPTTGNMVLENAALQTEPAPRPFLTYYAYQRVGDTPTPEFQLLATPLSKAAAARVARIDVAFASRPAGVNDADRHAVNVNDRVMIRHADPNLKVPDPACT